MNIYVTRHGVTLLNKQKKVNGEIDEPLEPEGLEQAKSLVSSIPASVKIIFSSPLLRAKQTAEVFSNELKLALFMQDELTEVKMGLLAGKAWEEMPNGETLKKNHRSVQFDYRSSGGESVDDVKKRLKPFLQKLANERKTNEVIFVTHGGIIRLFQLLERGEPSYETEKNVSLLSFDLNKMLKNL